MKNFYFWMLTLLCSTLMFGQLSENFESDITDRGWSLYQTGSDDPGFVMTNSQSYNGNYSYFHDDDFLDAMSTSFMVSPAYTVQSGDALSVYVRQQYSVLYYEYSGIMISTASGDPITNPSDFVEVWEAGAGFAEGFWDEVALTLDTYVGQTIYVAFVYEGEFSHRFFVDQFYIGATCDAPVATTNVISSCETNEYNVELDITDLGSASSLLVTDHLGNTQTTGAAGPLTFGPYDSGSTASFTLADEDNASCNIILTSTYLCAPNNDDCSTATEITSFPYNGSEDATGATQESFVSCGVDGSNDGVWYSFVGESAQYTVNVTSNNWDSAVSVLAGACGDLSCVAFSDNVGSNAQESITFIGQVGVTYYINVGAYSANVDLEEGPFELEVLYEEIPCGAPSNLASQTTTDLSSEVVWQGNTDNESYDLVWGETGFTPGASANATNLSNTSFTITQLTPETTYDVYVRGNCNPGLSEWVGPVTFTTLEEGSVLPGTDCIHPIHVTSLPFNTTDNTGNYGNDYPQGQGQNCGGTGSQYYLGGDEVVYAYTATEDTSINIYMDPLGTTWTSLFVYDSCDNINVQCVAGVPNTTAAVREIEDILISAGQTYYIVLSIWPSPNNYEYNLVITENTCVSGSFEFNTIGACETDEYTVELVVNNMGSLESYEISDDQGSPTQTITEVGTYTFGPYEQSFAVTFDGVANDENCSFSETINYFCPVPNDECENAIEIPVNPDFSCDLFISGSTLGATASPQEDDVVGTPNNDVWFDFVATATSHRVSLLNVVNIGGTTSTDMAMGVYDATNGCEALVFVDDSDPNILNLNGLNIGTTYLVRVYNWSSTIATTSFDICIGTPPSTDYDIECGTPLEMTYCYDSNENFTWNFVSSTDEPVTIHFTGGEVEDNFDIIRLYDGEVLLWDSYNANPNGTRFDLTGTVFTAMSGSLHLSFVSDGSVSCQATTNMPSWEFTVECGMEIPSIDWANLEGPESGTVSAGSEFLVYGQVYKEGVTEADGPAEEISAWIGYSTTDTHPETWDNWIPATFSSQEGDNDEYVANIGTSLPSAGTFYYATRYRLDWGTYYYGGYNQGEWDGTTNVSGVLNVMGPENDDCSGAIALECGVTVVGVTTVASASGLPTTCNGWTSSDGRDLFYSFEADGMSDYLISVDAGSGFDAVLHVYSGSCGDLVSVGCDDSGNPEQVELLSPAAGTYYVRVFDYSGTGEFELTMECTFNTCASATYEISPSTECEDDEFFVYIDFTDMGTLTSYVITDNQGNPAQTVTEVGEYTFGPYASMTEVTFDFVADDTNCSTTETFTYNCPAPGETCENPLIVDSLPYFTSDNTGLYGNDYPQGQGNNCGGTGSQYYLGGDDVVYLFTPENDTSINIYMDPLGTTWTSMFVYSSCANIGVECLAGVPNTTSDVRAIEDFEVFAGETYYIVLSIWPTPNNYDYTLTITENTCTSGEFTLNTIGSCETDEFSVEIVVTDMGSLDTYEVTDNQGSATQTITETGTLTFGPYPSGVEVVYSLVANDPNCNQTVSVLFHCPATNDECEDSIEVPVNPDLSCDLFISGSTLGATASPQTDDVVGTPNNDVWFDFVATSTRHTISLLNIVNLDGGTGVDMAFGVYDATGGCDALVLVDDSDPNVLTLSDLTVGTTYLIRVYNWSSTIYSNSFDVCIGTPPPPPPTEHDVECGTPVEITYCYGNNENLGWTFTSTTGDPLTINFTAGSVEDNWDFIRIYDGEDSSGTLLWDSENANPDGFRFELAGTSFTAESGVLYFTFTSDSSVSCEVSNDVHTWEFSVSCDAETPEAPINDECEGATELIVGENFEENMLVGTNFGATANDMDNPTCGNYDGGDVWYTVTVPENGVVYVETQSSGEVSNTGMAAYTGTCGNLVEFMCEADDTGFAMISASDLTPGEIVFIRVWSNDGSVGSFNISAWTDPMSVVDYAGAKAVKIYPNPTADLLNISGIEVKDVQVYAASGQLAKVRTSNNVVDTRGLQSGTYIIRITDNEGNVVLRKFIKK